MRNTLATMMNQIFDDAYFPSSRFIQNKLISTPALNVIEQKDGYQINLPIAGIDPKEVQVELNDKVLTLSYEHKEENQENHKQYLRQEYTYNSFSRSIVLPKNVDSSSIKASYQKGVLNIEIAKSPELQPKKIEIDIKD